MSVHCHESVLVLVVPQLRSKASFLTGPLVNSISAISVTVLQPVPFPKGAIGYGRTYRQIKSGVGPEQPESDAI